LVDLFELFDDARTCKLNLDLHLFLFQIKLIQPTPCHPI